MQPVAGTETEGVRGAQWKWCKAFSGRDRATRLTSQRGTGTRPRSRKITYWDRHCDGRKYTCLGSRYEPKPQEQVDRIAVKQNRAMLTHMEFRGGQ